MSDTESNNISEIIEIIVDALPQASQDFIIREVIPMRQLQDSYINWAMARLDGDKVEVAKQLGLSQKTIYNRIHRGDVNKSV